MNVGDLVKWRTPFDTLSWPEDRVGIVITVNHWVDSGAPDRNFGTDVMVLWPSGHLQDFFEDELEIVN